MQLLPMPQDDFKSLEALNSRLWSWVEAEYHMSPHKGLDGITPFDRWATAADDVTLPGPERDLDELFSSSSSTAFRVTVPSACMAPCTSSMLVWSARPSRAFSRRGQPIDVYFKGRKYKKAKTVDTYANCFVRRDHTTKHLYPDTPPRVSRRRQDYPCAISKRGMSRPLLNLVG